MVAWPYFYRKYCGYSVNVLFRTLLPPEGDVIDPKQYREMGARCRLMASEASHPGHQAALLKMAQRWADLADQVERAQVDNPSPPDPQTGHDR